MKKCLLTLISLWLLPLNIQAYDINEVDVRWTSYKTLSKIGVDGRFKDSKLIIQNKNAKSIKDLLKNARIKLNLKDLDIDNGIKTKALQMFFVNSVDKKIISAKIIKIESNSLEIKIKLNGISKNIPMNYSIKKGIISAKGVIDIQDFKLEKALKNLTKNVAIHLGKGWFDVDISFTIDIKRG